ncbi:hypothetical protein KAR91_14190 [Candidatus Pacearchaeota archaeon]|nr:hypothetical protein [Candidatus Pacearchaeota archaeon]
MPRKPNLTRGLAKQATGRTLAHQSRNSMMLSRTSKLKASQAAATHLIEGTIEANRARRLK